MPNELESSTADLREPARQEKQGPWEKPDWGHSLTLPSPAVGPSSPASARGASVSPVCCGDLANQLSWCSLPLLPSHRKEDTFVNKLDKMLHMS